jgi:hypothetical protein
MSEAKAHKAKAEPVVCPLKECAHQGDCVITEITGKAPKPGGRCSYFEKEKSSKSRKDSGKEIKDDDV